MPAEQTNIKVAVRVRPYSRREMEQNQRCIIKVMDDTTLLFDPEEEDDEFFFHGSKQNYRDLTKRVNKKISMEFDHVFDTDVGNVQIFQQCTAPLIDSVLNGYNCSVFVYGATGAGKTFTMLGNDSNPGITFLTMRDLFEKIEAQDTTRKFDVGVSYLEVYNEHVMNLLTKSGPLKLREDSNGVVVSGLILKPIYSAEELLDLLKLGNSHRTQHPTDANAESSRSHAIFQVHIRMTERKTGTKRTVKLSMIDLAGSERAASTKGIGVRFKEGASINKSLLALGNCINKLADGLKHIPYRDSNLTRILKDSLGGNCKTLMVANVSMSSLTYEDTYNTLKYASRAKKIRTTLRQNVLKSNMPKDFYIKKVNELMAENERLKEVGKSSEIKMQQLQQKTATVTSRCYDENELKSWYSKIDAVYSYVIKTQEYVIGMQSKIKNFSFRKKLQEETLAFNKILNFKPSSCQENFACFTSSTKHNETQKEELRRWRKKLQDANKDLEKLKREIKDSKHSDILQIYQKGKDLEIQYSKQNINFNHITSINTEVVVNSYKVRQAFTLACEILQNSYSNLKSEDKLTTEIQQGLEKLQHIINASSNAYMKDVYKKDSDEDLELTETELHVNNKTMPLTNDDDTDADSSLLTEKHKQQRQRYKRLHFDDDFDLGLEEMDDTDSDGPSCSNKIFKKPRIAATRKGNPNETQILSSTSNDDNDERSAEGTKNKINEKRNFVSTILSEQMSRLPPAQNKDKLKSILVKSKNFNHQGLLKTVAAGVQKENKKYSPARIRKSPRLLMPKVCSSTANLKRPAIRTVNSSSDVPAVRINRAASFRFKK